MSLFKDIHLFLGNISGTLKLSLVRNKCIFQQVKPFLASGKYRNSLYCDYIYKIDGTRHLDKKTFASTFTINRYARKIVALITKLICYENKSDNTFGGTEIIISSSLSEYKVFNIQRELVLTYYKDKEKLSVVAQNKEIFKNHFNVSTSTELDIENHFLIEQYIHHVPFEKDKALFHITNQYIQYAKSDVIPSSTITEEHCNTFVERFGESTLLQEITQYPSIYSHGDLWASNIMYDGTTYYITDFESAGPKYLLFDFFMFVFSEYIVNGDLTMLEKYFEGQYDDILSDVMKGAKLAYNSNKRGSYLLAYLVEMVNERWRNYRALDCKIEKILIDYIKYK